MANSKAKHDSRQTLMASIVYLIMYLMVGLIPHIYKYTPFTVAGSESIYFKDALYADLYMLAKSRVFLGLTVVLVGLFLYQLSKKEIKLIKDKITIVTGIFGLVILLSSVLSSYQDIVYWGAKDRFEGMWVWLAYLIVFTVARHYGSNKLFVDRLLKVFVFSASVMAIFGIMQIFGYDIYTAGPLRWLCFPKEMATNLSQYMVTNVTEAGAVGALFNSNYFGVYIGLAALIALGFTFIERSKNALYLIVFIVLYGAMIVSGSEAALLGFAVALFFFMLAFGKVIWQKKIYLAGSFVLAVVIDRYLAFNLLTGQSNNAKWLYLLMFMGIVIGLVLNSLVQKKKFNNPLFKKYSLFISGILILITAIGINVGVGLTGQANLEGTLKSINYDKNILVLEHMNETSIGVEFLPQGLNVYDQDMTLLQPEIVGENLLSYNSADINYTFEVRNYDNGVLLLFKSPTSLHIFYDGQKLSYVHPISGIGQIEKPDRLDYYFNYGSAYTRRAYLWSTYLPIAQENFLVGVGVDTYLPAYPQNDYFGKESFYAEGDRILVDKPHSMYIGVLFAFGIVGVFVLLGFAVIIGRQYFDFLDEEDRYNNNLLLLIGVVMILMAGVFNDSVIPVTILLSCFGGMGLTEHDEIN